MTGTGTKAATTAPRVPTDRAPDTAAATSSKSLSSPTVIHRLRSPSLSDRSAATEPTPTTKSRIPTVRVISTNGPEGSPAACIFSTDLGAMVSVTPTARRRKARPPATERPDVKRDTPRTLLTPAEVRLGYTHHHRSVTRLAIVSLMTRTSTADWPCTIARSVDLFGEGWTLLIMRQAFFGTRRFEDFQKELGISRNILTLRLNRLVEDGLFEQVEYQQRPVRFEYRLTEKGRDVFPIVAAMAAYGDKWLVGDEGTPLILYHTDCDRDMHAVVTCSECAEPLTLRKVKGRRGPGYPAAGA